MLVLLSCAKTMHSASKTKAPLATNPQFAKEAAEIAMHMSQFTVEELEHALRINSKLGVENYKRFQDFHSEDNHAVQAVLAYTGIVFKYLNPKGFTKEDFMYAQDHLRLTSFCYGLLRPMDMIKNYRLEGDVKLPELGGISMFEYWRPKLTDTFIAAIKAAGGTLINLASNEMKSLFDWKRVENEVRIITPEFKVIKNGKADTVVVYTKMSRGAMTNFILTNRIEKPELLKQYSWEGFEFDETLSDNKTYTYILKG